MMPRNTFLVYGESRSGKTTWAASFPRPLFLSDATEGGWDSIANMDDSQFFEPGVRPIIFAIEQMNDMATAREKAAPLIASGRVQTIVVDSLSYYCDLILNYLLNMQGKKDTRAAYGDLGNHLRDLRVKTHMLPVNVVWLALASRSEEGEGRPMIPGQQGDKFMAGCHYIFHSRSFQQKHGQELLPPEFEMRTRRWNGNIAGNRLGGKAAQLPDPLVGNYETLISALGYNPGEIRRNLPKLEGKPVAPAKLAQPAAKPAVNQQPQYKVTKVDPTNVVPPK
jgi:hypothetical protein